MSTTSQQRALSEKLPSGGLLIGTDRVTGSSGGTYEHIYPANGRPNGIVELAGAAEIDAAVTAAREAQREWISYPVDKRRDLLLDLADALAEHGPELARLNVHDFAVPLTRAGHGVIAQRFLRYYAGYADKAHGLSTPVTGSPLDLNIVEREPYGVVGVITPWNGSLGAVGFAVAPALAAGNGVVLKPPELTPYASLRFGELCLEVGLPAGLVNVVPAAAEGGEALVRHPGIGKLHFTGGGDTAKKIITGAAENLTPVVTELGGKAANLVFADADLDLAVKLAAMMGPVAMSGQSCACGSRILVQEAVYDAFLEKFVAEVEGTKVGDPFDPDTVIGPVVSQRSADRILGIIDRAVSEKAGELVTGGRRMGGELADGYSIEPTVFTGVANDTHLAQTEVFGPVVAVTSFKDEEEAIGIANDTPYGLNAYLMTTDLNRAHRVARRLEAGSVWINKYADIQPQGPYGGYKQSGAGRTGGVEGLHEFMQIKNIRIGMR